MSDFDRLKVALQQVLRQFLRQLDYSCLYGAKVVGQNSDGTLELTPTTPGKLPPLSKVPIRYGIPGISVLVNPGALALVGFADADPAQPYAFLINGASLESLTFLGGTQPVARQGDAVSVFFPAVIPFTGTISGLPAEGTITIEPSSAPGIILTGNPNVTA